MSGFSEEWLALREPADHAARNPRVLAALAARFHAREQVQVVDLGSGSGSNLRGLADHLPLRQSWHLVDRDLALADAARRRLAAWADAAVPIGDGLRLSRAGRSIDVTFVQADLAGEFTEQVAWQLAGQLAGHRGTDGGADLVTAAALFDLVSPPWMGRLVACLAQRAVPLYAALTYDGRFAVSPPHAHDGVVLAAFHAHQHRDKGFGPAAGPEAATELAAALARVGYDVATGDSCWRLGRNEAALIAATLQGIAEAAAETGRLADATCRNWLAARRQCQSCRIGHTDLLAWPAAAGDGPG